MNRRDFVTRAAVASVLAETAWQAHAQGASSPSQSPAEKGRDPDRDQGGGFVEGRHYVRLGTPQPVLAPTGKIEVVEFFWYGCPHCNAFEPALDAWSKTLPADVMLRRVPVAFRPQFIVHQRLFYALEAMGQLETMHRRVFNAIHVDHQRLDDIESITEFVAKNGVDRARFREVFDSFSIQAKTRQAAQLADGYRIDGVPALGIHGRFYTSPSLVGGEGAPPAQAHTMALRLTDRLIAQVRSGR